jgi:hypothetical protein
MAEQNDAGPEKKGFFAKRKEAKEAAKAAKALPQKIPTPPLRTGAPQARPAAPPPRPAPPPPEVRVSLESLPEVEKRIDRMSAVERRQKLLDRYEQKYGEKLDAPKVFVSIEDDKKAEAAAAADAMAGGKAVDEAKLAAVTGMAPPKPAAPAPKPAPPAKTGFFGAKPAPPPAAKIGAPAPPKPAAPAPARPAAPVAAAPEPAQPGIPVKYTGGAFWKYLWHPGRFPMRAIAKLKYPGNQSKLNMYTAADGLIWVLLVIPRFAVLLWAGLIGVAVSKYILKKKPEAAEPSPAAN